MKITISKINIFLKKKKKKKKKKKFNIYSSLKI